MRDFLYNAVNSSAKPIIFSRQVSPTLKAPDTTLLEWAPSGDLYFTATTSPRLRQGNGFKIWHYTGSLLYEMMWPEKQELLELSWKKFPQGTYKETVISYQKVEGIQSVQKQASDKKYVPPNIRAFGENNTSASSAAPPAHGPIPVRFTIFFKKICKIDTVNILYRDCHQVTRAQKVKQPQRVRIPTIASHSKPITTQTTRTMKNERRPRESRRSSRTSRS